MTHGKVGSGLRGAGTEAKARGLVVLPVGQAHDYLRCPVIATADVWREGARFRFARCPKIRQPHAFHTFEHQNIVWLDIAVEDACRTETERTMASF